MLFLMHNQIAHQLLSIKRNKGGFYGQFFLSLPSFLKDVVLVLHMTHGKALEVSNSEEFVAEGLNLNGRGSRDGVG